MALRTTASECTPARLCGCQRPGRLVAETQRNRQTALELELTAQGVSLNKALYTSVRACTGRRINYIAFEKCDDLTQKSFSIFPVGQLTDEVSNGFRQLYTEYTDVSFLVQKSHEGAQCVYEYFDEVPNATHSLSLEDAIF